MIRSYNNADANDKYKFTEKERDKETNLDYFGARYYDASIGRWLNIDPLAEKYPSWSPYNYCINNPLIVYDPDGKEIWISEYDVDDYGEMHLKEQYQYRDGKLYDKKGNLYLGTNKYIREVQIALNNLLNYGDKEITDKIKWIENNEFKNEIHNFSCGASKVRPHDGKNANLGDPQGVWIQYTGYDPNDIEMPTIETILGHELQHTYDFNKGNMKGIKEDSKKHESQRPHEVRAIIFENIIRNYQGIEKRTTYDGKEVDFNNTRIRK